MSDFHFESTCNASLTRRALFLFPLRQAKLTLLASRSQSPTSPRRRSHSGSPRECGIRTPGSPSDGRNHGSPPGASRRRNNPGGRALRRTRSGSVLSPTSSPPARDFSARVSRFPDDAKSSSARASDPDAETADETTRVLMEAKAALEARALALAEETARANARVAKLEADVAEHARVLELERTELRKERDAHDATRNALRTNAMAASRREAALTFSLDVQKQKSAIARIPADILTDTHHTQTQSDARRDAARHRVCPTRDPDAARFHAFEGDSAHQLTTGPLPFLW